MSNQIDLIYAKSVEEQLGRILPQLEAHHKKIIDISKTQIDFFGGKTAKSPADLGKVETQYKKIVDSIEKTRLAEIKLQQAREKAFDDYQKTIDKKAQAEQKSAEKAIRESERIIKQKEKEFAKFERDFNKYEADLAKQAIAEQKAKKAKVQAILDESKAIQSLQRQKEKAIADEAKEQAKLKASENLYNRVQQKLNALSNEYKALATKKELGLTLTDKETQKYTSLQGRIQKYDATLKAVDATMGKHQRNVGNYASGFNVLGNAFNQLSREAPAFANSMQTGFMAISNNLPILFDAIGQTNRELKQMRAEGKEVPSLLSKIAGSIFSVGTLLSATVTILTLFGPQLVEAFTGGSKATEQFKENISDVNSTTTETAVKLKLVKEALNSTTTSQSDLNTALKIAQQEGISLNAIEEARKGNLALINDEIEKQIVLSIKKAKADKLVNLIAENEIEQLKQAKKNSEAYTGFWNKALTSIPAIGYAMIKKRRDDEKQSLMDLQNQNAQYYEMLRALGLESLADTEKVNKEKTKKEHDYLKDKYDARLSELELELQVIDTTLNNDETLYATRLYALELHRKKRNEIIALQYNEEMRLAKDNQDLQLIALNKYHSESLKEIEAYAQKELEINKSRLKPAEAKLMADNQAELAKNIKKATDEFIRNAKAMKDNEERMRKLKEITDAYLTTFQSEFFSNAGLPTLFKILNDEIVGFGTNFAVTFNSIAEVAQEAFQYIQQASNANFQNEYRNLETQYNVARKFAGDNADAQDEIDRQMEIRRREIRRREFKANQKMAILNIAINTAQGVVSALASTPPNILLSAIIAGIGIAQTAIVAGQQMPEYWKGTDNHIGGLMKVNDQKGGNYQEAVVLPNKKVILPQGRDVIMNAPKGTKVYNADKTREMLDSIMFNDQLNNILSSNGIGSSFQPNNTTLNDQNIVSELREVVKAIDGIPVPSSRITNGDLENFIETKTTRIKQTNARRTFTPRNT